MFSVQRFLTGGLFQHPARSAARLIALLTIQRLSKMLVSTCLCQDPGSIRHRGLMTHMLAMTTMQIGHPITKFVQMIADNGLMQRNHRFSKGSSCL